MPPKTSGVRHSDKPIKIIDISTHFENSDINIDKVIFENININIDIRSFVTILILQLLIRLFLKINILIRRF